MDRAHPEGYKPGQLKKEKKQDFRYPSAVAHEDLQPPRSAKDAQLQYKRQAWEMKYEEIPEPEPNEWRVYVLREKTDGPCSYVGHTGRNGKLPEERLA